MAIWNALKEIKTVMYPTFWGYAKHPRTKLTRIINVRVAFPSIAKSSDHAAKCKVDMAC